MKTLGQLLLQRIEKQAQDRAVGEIKNGQVHFLTFSEYYKRIEDLAFGLHKIGLRIENKVSLLAQTRIEWHLTDAAILSLRGVVVPVYPSYLPKELLYILNHSESSFLVVENTEQLEKLLIVQNQVKYLHTIIAFDPIKSELKEKLNKRFSFYQYAELFELGAQVKKKNPNLVKDEISKQQEDDTATLIYTSGTTGEPKGAVITHKAFANMLSNVAEVFRKDTSPKDILLTFLPLSHVLGRMDSWIPVGLGLQNVYAESINKIVENISLVKPTIMVAVPRIFEKIYDRIQQMIEESSSIKKGLFHWAEKASARYYDKIEQNRAPSTKEIMEEKLAYKLVFSKINKRFGGNINFFISGGAPISPEIVRFLRKAHLTILEGYGLTETIAPCFANPLRRQVLSSVGLIFPNTEIKFASDGEILIKSNAMFSEYYKNPEATAEAIQEGWFHTGDIGHMDQDGYLFITDRKKDLIITSGGKNVAPQMIENMMKLERHIAQFVVIGDRRKYLTALVGIEKEAFEDQWSRLGLEKNCPFEEFAKHAKVRTVVEREIEKVNKKLARFETIKNFYIVPLPFSPESGLLTPSQKVKKKLLIEKYQAEIDAMYQQGE